MKKCLLIAILGIFIGGCSTYKGVGSSYWHTERLQELKSAYDAGKITAAEYFELQNETDRLYQDYQRPRYIYPAYHFGYGYRHHRHRYD